MIVTAPARATVGDGPARSAPPDIAAWRDALVELLVLAEHGDTAAMTSLRAWLSVDPDAVAASAAIHRAVDAVRAV